jgi:type I restriction enzyme S subunit
LEKDWIKNMTTWLKQKVSDIAIEQLIRYTPTSTENLPYIGLEHIEEGALKLNSIGSSDEVKSQKKKFYKGDVLYGSLRPYFRKVIKAKFDGVSSTDITVLKPKENVNRDFLFYLVASQEFINKASMASNGTKMPRAGWKIVKDFSFSIPEPGIQSIIGLMLSAYDDLIESNEKRIKILEEMAQRLYTEWFVKFKFPGHEKVKMVDSPLGKIPEGWEVKKIKDIGKVITGKTPPTNKPENFSGDILFIKTPDLHGNIFILDTEQTLSDLSAQSQSSKMLPEKTVFVSCIGTLGVVGITSKLSQTNQQINAIVAGEDGDYCMFYFFVKGLKKHLIGLGSNGATMGNVNKDKFENIKMFYPDKKIREEFFNLTSNLFDEILNLEKQIKTLAKTRDLLIPQLVTGRLKLKEPLF